MKASSNTIEIEVGATGDRNVNLMFPPLSKRVRGRFDPLRSSRHDKEASSILNLFDAPIPGQILGLDLDTGTGYIREQLHDDAYEAMRAKIVKRSRLAPAREEFPNAHIPTWLHWLKRSVETGAASVVMGELPAKIEGDVQYRTPFARYAQEHQDPVMTLGEAIDRQTAAFERQTAALEKLVSEFMKAAKR